MSSNGYRAKGRVLKAYGKYIKRKWGVDGLTECSKTVGTDIEKIMDEKWYDYKLNEDILDWLVDNHGEEYARKAGFAVVAERGVISFVARVAGIRRVLDRAMLELRDVYDFGEINVEMNGKSATLHMRDVSRSRRGCQAWLGALEGIMHITGAKGTVTKESCQLDGSDNCTYIMNWN